jgi:hypothetical protein
VKWQDCHKVTFVTINSQFISVFWKGKEKDMKTLWKEMAKDLVALLPKKHYECEDPWYSCPKAEYSVSHRDDPREKKECTCGFDKAQEVLKKWGLI